MNRKLAVALATLLAAGTAAGADETRDPVEIYAQLPAILDPHLSPDGTQVAFLGMAGGRYHVVIERYTPEFRRYMLLPGEGLAFKWVRWVNDERLLVAGSGTGRRDLAVLSNARYLRDTEETRMVSINNTATDLVEVIRPGRFKPTGTRVAQDLPVPQFQDNVVGWLPDDPEHVLVALDSNFDTLGEIRRVDVRNGKYEDIVSNFMGPNWVTDAKGTARFTWGPTTDNLDVRASYADAAGDWSDVSSSLWFRTGYLPLAIDADTDVATVIGPNAEGREVIRKLDLSSGEFLETLVADPDFDVGGPVYDDATDTLVGAWIDGDESRIEYFDATFAGFQRNLDAALPDARNLIVSTSKGHRQVFFLSAKGAEPGAYYLWDRDAKSLDFYAAVMPDLTPEQLAPVRPVSYAARDGLEIPAYLTLPAGGSKALPAIVMPHGGPHARDDGGYDFIAQYLASLGYAVLQPNFRGSTGYGDTFEKAGAGEWGGKMQDDIADGAEWLVEQGIAETDRVCIVGWSFGGYAAALGVAREPERYRCAASINGVLDLPRLMDRNIDFEGGRMSNEDIGVTMAEADRISPYHLADKIKAPMLLVHAVDDGRVVIDQARDMAKRLEKQGNEVTLVEIEFGGHELRNVAAREQILRALGDFLAAYNPAERG